jgi:predicted phage terminase large subunit-like protein
MLRAARVAAALSAEDRIAISDEARVELMRRSLAWFVRGAWHVLEGGPLEWAPHIQALCDHIQQMLEGWLIANGMGTERQRARVVATWKRHGLKFRRGRLLVQNSVINACPGSLKSRILMVFAPAWMWLHAPRFFWACSSANDENVKRDSAAHRDLIESKWYRQTFEIEWTIRRDQDAIGKWTTTAGGTRLSRTLLGSWTGVHADGIFVDDPDDAARVFNDPTRERVHVTWSKKLENRVNHELRTIRIVAQQRVHVEDLSGYLLALTRWAKNNLGGWDQLCIVMELGKGPKTAPAETAFGWRDQRAKGDLLQPMRWPREWLDEKRIKLGSHGYESQYNQNPEPIDGGMIRRIWFPFFRVDGESYERKQRPEGCRERPTDGSDDCYVIKHRPRTTELALDWLTITVDATFGSLKDTASAVGLLVIGGQGMRRFLFDDKTEPMTFLTTCAKIKELVRKWPAKRCLIEMKANGASVIESLKAQLQDGKLIGPNGNSVIVVIDGVDTGSDGKVARANAMVPALEAGTFYLPDSCPHWLDPWLAELCVFPKARRNDRVDATSQLMAHYAETGERAKRSAAW